MLLNFTKSTRIRYINNRINILKKDQFKNGIHLSLCTYRFRDMGGRTYQGDHWS